MLKRPAILAVIASLVLSGGVVRAVTAAPTEPPTKYFVGADTEDITPDYGVNLGGFGLGDGSVLPESVAGQSVVGRGGYWAGPGAGGHKELIRARAVVFDDGTHPAVAIASIETQGMFAAYDPSKYGAFGLHDMAVEAAKETTQGNKPGLLADHIVIATDHTHHGPDTIGAWGGVPNDYLKYVYEQTVNAIVTAYNNKKPATIVAGQSDASDLIYNQSCTEALNQDPTPSYTGPDVCATPGKDGMMRVVQARTYDADPQTGDHPAIVTLVVYAAHATTNMGSPLDGDWPQFIGDDLASTYGGVGIGMEGANGGTQPCRPTCSFTSQSERGYGEGRFQAITDNYMSHIKAALGSAQPVTGPVLAAQAYIREAIAGPFVTGLFALGSHIGTPLMRSHDSPWMVGQTIRTVVADVRVGNLLFDATPGEGFPAIRQGVQDAVNGPQMVLQLGLANDQLGYLIAPISYVPIIGAEIAVNDNIIFNVSPTIGDHVMCADIALAHSLGDDWTVSDPATCAGYDAADAAQVAAGDPISSVPVGGVVVP